ncbi:MAG: hypothetical protein K6C69_01285 [Lachnospiraceae bacterium]|nr:hypothetical protein [Lachnospiraceae bacterium]
MLTGAMAARKKDGTIYYRSSITVKNRHISLGSFATEKQAHKAYLEAKRLLEGKRGIEAYEHAKERMLSFDRWVSLVNFRDHGMYIKTPIYLRSKYFEYYLAPDSVLKFDVDDLFYYSKHTIQRRDGYLFVADYGMQVNIMSRYGIHNHAVLGRDYEFANGDPTDYRYGNIILRNHFHGVSYESHYGKMVYKARIHIVSEYVIGSYEDEITAAIAYNKAVDLLKKQGISRAFTENYVEISPKDYARIYSEVKISSKIRHFQGKIVAKSKKN